jgi:hypothetical protein
LLQFNCNDGMRPTAGFVHLGASDGSVLIPFISFLINHFIRVTWVLAQPFHIYRSRLALSNFQPTLRFLLWVDKKVLNLLIINLQHRKLNLKLQVFILIFANPFKNLIASNGYNTLVPIVSYHWIAFTRAGLAVGEEAAMVSLPCIIKHLLS